MRLWYERYDAYDGIIGPRSLTIKLKIATKRWK